MYFANSSLSSPFAAYKFLLENYLKEGEKDAEIKLMFENIIRTTQKLATGKIISSDVDHKIYTIVTKLADYNQKYFADIQQVDTKAFRSLDSILTSLVDEQTV